jgi:hypothetical protein
VPKPKKPKSTINVNWQQTPEWQKKVSTVMRLKEKGYDENQIQMVTQFEPIEVRRICNDESIAVTTARENLKNKIPLIKDIVGMGLEAIKETLKTLQNPEVRANMLAKVSDVAALTKVITDLNTLLRLEQGQSTENISTVTRSYQETRMVLQELKKKDPVFDYPELPEPSHEQ